MDAVARLEKAMSQPSLSLSSFHSLSFILCDLELSGFFFDTRLLYSHVGSEKEREGHVSHRR